MTIGWLDCAAGASGDMFLGALVDSGVPLPVLQSAIDALDVEPVELRAEPVTRHGLAAVRVHVDHPESHVDRRYTAIRDLIETAELPTPVKEHAVDAFTRLGHAEAAAHRVPLDRVHFHEVGALDSLADVVAACAGLHWLTEHRGLTTVTASTVTVGGGVTRGAHGGIPLPAPATLAVLSAARAPVTGDVPYEACTPTGAALVAAHAHGYGPMPPMVVDTVGCGAGGRDPAERANLLRLVLGQPVETTAPAEAVLLAANVDDLDPRLWPDVLAALLAAGASDAWLTPVLMKKGRPAHTLQVLCADPAVPAVTAAVFRHTTTIGLRSSRVGKHTLPRRFGEVALQGHTVAVKIAEHDGTVGNISVEHRDVVAAAAALDIPVKHALAEATALAWDRYGR